MDGVELPAVRLDELQRIPDVVLIRVSRLTFDVDSHHVEAGTVVADSTSSRTAEGVQQPRPVHG